MQLLLLARKHSLLFVQFAGEVPVLTTLQFSSIVANIYDCALDPARWDGTVSEIKALFGSDNAILGLFDTQGQRMLLSKDTGMEPDWTASQAPYFGEQAAFFEKTMGEWPSFDEPVALSRLTTPEERAASPYLREWAAPRGIVDVLCLILMHTPNRVARLDMGFHARNGVVTDDQIEIGRLIVPHIRRAAIISNMLDVRTIERNRMAETLDVIKYGVVLARENSHILHANTPAEALLREGALIKSTGGVLHAIRPQARKELQNAIGLAARDETKLGKTGISVMLTPPDAAPVIAHVLPLAKGDYRTRLMPTAAAAIFIGSTADLKASARSIALQFGLTPSEQKVLAELLAGRTLAEAAKGLEVTVNTARTHLANIFSKAGVSRQADLIRLAAQMDKLVSP